jgi:hypothetical protein
MAGFTGVFEGKAENGNAEMLKKTGADAQKAAIILTRPSRNQSGTGVSPVCSCNR